MVTKCICPWHRMLLNITISPFIKDSFVSYSVIFFSPSGFFDPVVQTMKRSGSCHWSMLFCVFSLSVKNIPWFPGAQWDRKWPPTTVLSAVSLELCLPHPTWGPSTSVRMVCLAPPRTSCPHRTRTRCPRSTAKFTIAPRGKVSATALPTWPLSFLLLSLEKRKST